MIDNGMLLSADKKELSFGHLQNLNDSTANSFSFQVLFKGELYSMIKIWTLI